MLNVTNLKLILYVCIVNTMIVITIFYKLVKDNFLGIIKDPHHDTLGFAKKVMPRFFLDILLSFSFFYQTVGNMTSIIKKNA